LISFCDGIFEELSIFNFLFSLSSLFSLFSSIDLFDFSFKSNLLFKWSSIFSLFVSLSLVSSIFPFLIIGLSEDLSILIIK